MKKRFTIIAIFILGRALSGSATVESESSSQGYRIDQPGTITFTVGVKIEGKVEKPQVMIFLPKEKPYYRELQFSRSLREELMEPLPLSPIID